VPTNRSHPIAAKCPTLVIYIYTYVERERDKETYSARELGHMYIHLYTHVCTSIYTCMYIYTHMYVHLYTHICKETYSARELGHMYIHLYTHVCTSIYTCIYIYIHMYVKRHTVRESWVTIERTRAKECETCERYKGLRLPIGYLIFTGHFPQKEPCNQWLFCGK